MEDDDDFDFEENLKILEKKIEAKKGILKEVLRSVESEQDEKESARNRKYIRNILNCDVSQSNERYQCASVKQHDSFRFQQHVIVRIRVKSLLNSSEISVRVSTSSPIRSIRWNIFANEFSPISNESVKSNSSAILCVSIPLIAFFENDKISLIVHCKSVSNGAQVFTPTFYAFLGANLSSEAPPEDVTSFSIDLNDAVEEVDVKSVEFVDEHKAVKILHSLMTSYHRLPITANLANFRREFARFSNADFDSWRLLIGSDRFDGVFVYNSIDSGEGNEVIAKDLSICQTFLKVVNEKLGME